MPTHKVTFEIMKPLEIINKDLKIDVKKDGKQFGTLTLSKGSIDWRPKNWKRGYEPQRTWTQFDKMMREG